MDDVHYEEQDQTAVLQSDIDGEWLTSDAIVDLRDWA